MTIPEVTARVNGNGGATDDLRILAAHEAGFRQATPRDLFDAPPAGSTRSAADLPGAIVIRGVTKRYGEVAAVDDLTLTVRAGEVFGLLGPNGSGKTTTINMLCGLVRPTSGSIEVMGNDVSETPRAVRAALGTVPQETALYEELSAWRNMMFHAELYGVRRRDRKERVGRLLELVELTDRQHDRVRTFSGGMKRRLALARALLHEPQVVYLDEPTLGVDVQSRRALWDYILRLRAEGKTVLLTTNYLEEASALCDRVAIIDRGRLVALDTPQGLRQRFGGSTLIFETAIPLDPDIVALLETSDGVVSVRVDARHVEVDFDDSLASSARLVMIAAEGYLTSMTQRESTLDEVFLRLTGRGRRD